MPVLDSLCSALTEVPACMSIRTIIVLREHASRPKVFQLFCAAAMLLVLHLMCTLQSCSD